MTPQYRWVVFVPCPTCGEPEGFRCKTKSGRRLTYAQSHSPRFYKATGDPQDIVPLIVVRD